MRSLTAMACAIALGVYAAAPAIADDSTKKQAEQKADKIEKQAEQKADQIERDAKQKAGEVRQQGDAAADLVRGKSGATVGDKMDRALDKTMKAVTGNGTADRDIRAAQRALQAKGFNPGPIDGLMGPRTSAALREFQQKEDLKETGRLDAETRAHLMASSGAPAASPASGPTAPSVKPQTR